MTIKKEAVYTIKEAHDILGIHPKKLNRIAVKNNLHKIDNRYLFTGEFLIKYFNLTDVQESLKVSKDVQESETEINNLQDQLTEVNTELEKTQDELSQIDLLLREYKVIEVNDDTENEAGEFFTVIGLKKYLEAPAEPSPEPSPQLDLEVESLKAELKQYEIKDNERLEVFTNEEYNLFEQRLKEWQTQRLEIEHQEQLFTTEKKSLNELYNHYKSQFEYQKNANEKILNMHQALIDLIGEQNKLTIQRQIIEAKEKDVINDKWKPK
mgnify:CR=1 FL=1